MRAHLHRDLSEDETLAYLAHLERPLSHARLVATLLQESIDNMPSQGDPNRSARTRRLALTLYTQKAQHLVKAEVWEGHHTGPRAGDALTEASTLLLQGAVQFRKCVPRHCPRLFPRLCCQFLFGWFYWHETLCEGCEGFVLSALCSSKSACPDSFPDSTSYDYRRRCKGSPGQ